MGPGGSSAVGSSEGASRGSCGGSWSSGGSSALGSSVGASWGSGEDATTLFTSTGASWACGGKAKDGERVAASVGSVTGLRLDELSGRGKIGPSEGFGGLSFGGVSCALLLWIPA